MLAVLKDAPFDDKNWVFEIKYDGYRALALCDPATGVDLYSRNLLSFNRVYKPLVSELEKISHSCLLDGEVVVEDEKGRSHFQLLQNYQKNQKGELRYYVFDLLNLDGNDTTKLPLTERKELLKLLLSKKKLDNVFYSDHIEERGVGFYKAAFEKGLEGIIAKRVESIYQPGRRSTDWLKIKITNEQEVIIAGITAPKGSRNYFGSLLLAVYKMGELEFVGHCGTGFDEATLKDLYTKFKSLFVSKSPFNKKIKVNGEVQWLKPKLVCEVKFSEWTTEGIMRHPVYLGLRSDKSAKQVVHEKPAIMKIKNSKPEKPKAKKISKGLKEGKEKLPDDNGPAQKKGDTAEVMKVGKVELKLTNQQKIYWPAEKITKGDLVSYYKDISAFILPYLKDRPQSLNRFPNGIKGASFYQKDINRDIVPAWLKTENIYSESNKANIDYLICNDQATLIYMANLGCIEINPWNSRITNITNPDWLVVDLDPEDISFKEVVKAALETKKVCDSMEIDCYCKTSGATGLHIYVPLAAKYDYEIARNFANLIAKKVNAALPDTTSLLRVPQKRKKKVYLDFLQNSKGQTLAAAYSVRPKPGATVSTPLEWKEVNDKLDPTLFTIKTIFKRLDKKGDLWKSVLGKGADIKKVLGKMQ